jgi:large subunit ribosomal protein L21
MFAVCEIQGKQYQLETGKSVLVDRLTQDVGNKIAYETVLSLHDGDTVTLGTPYVAKVKIEAEVEAHVRGKKLRVFKRRRRKDSKKLQGFRHDFTQIKITKITN